MIQRERQGDVLILRLAHGKASALDVELCEAIVEQIEESMREGPSAIVLTGSGSIFSAGVDLFRLTREGAPYVERFLPALERAIRAVFELEAPLVVAVNGHAIAGGCILAAAGDLRLMAAGKGRIGAPELLVGVPFPTAALEVLRFVVPPQHVQKLVYTGATLTPEEALGHGLVDEVVAPEELVTRAVHLAHTLGAIAPEAFAAAKRQLRSRVTAAIDASTASHETLRVWSDPATHARINAYLEKTVARK